MARSEAQREADKRYAEKVKDKHRHFAVNLKVEEYEALNAEIEAAGMTKADFLRWALEQLKSARRQ